VSAQLAKPRQGSEKGQDIEDPKNLYSGFAVHKVKTSAQRNRVSIRIGEQGRELDNTELLSKSSFLNTTSYLRRRLGNTEIRQRDGVWFRVYSMPITMLGMPKAS
jgi:hypothetical protein